MLAPVLKFLIKNVKAKAALIHIAPLHPLIQVHGVLVIRVNFDFSPQAPAVRFQFQRSRFIPAQHQPGLMIDQAPDIIRQCAVKSRLTNAFRRPWPDFIH